MSRETAVADPHWSEPARLLTGEVVQVTLATVADFDVVQAFYEQLGNEAIYSRFFTLRRPIPETQLREVVEASSKHVTMLVWLEDRLIGIGEYIIGDQSDDAKAEAEVAFAVADDHHREGVATLLLERLALLAHDRGLRRFTAMVLADNRDMQLVFSNVGLTTSTQFEDGVVDVTLDLTSVVGLIAATRLRHPLAHIETADISIPDEHSGTS